MICQIGILNLWEIMHLIFLECIKLTSLNLSNYNTEKAKDMNSIFEGRDSIKLTDISNFYMIGCYIFNDMFTNTTNIIYINIKNMQNDRTIGDIFNNKKEVFYVCQTTNIINNPVAINCCDYIINPDSYNVKEIFIRTTDEKMPEFITTDFLIIIYWKNLKKKMMEMK